MRIPTRSASRPPINASQTNLAWGSTNDIFGSALTTQPVQKKKPPPRPPPPKFNQNYVQSQKEKQKKPVRPTELLTNFFGRKKQEQPPVIHFSTQVPHTVSQPGNTNGSICLIDLSPPGSPTFTTRSSSDGVSVDSFGSDGNSNPSVFTSSGNTSQTESAFEDDFDFFGMPSKKTTSLAQNDPWQIKPMLDPFGPIEESNHNTSQTVKHVGDARFFAFSTDNVDNHVPSIQLKPKPVISMPTIIRGVKPAKPPAPKLLQKKAEQASYSVGTESKRLSKVNAVPFNESVTVNLTCSWVDDFKDNPSPPMPTIPPPAPPLESFADSKEDLAAGIDEPYGVALYDFPLTHPDDLPFKEGDVIRLVKKINDDWMEGRLGNRQGMFPVNFIDIKVPLPGVPDNIVTAIYPFKGETAEDLSFDEGAKITVLSRVSQDWFYGEYGGRRGQFPANYVNRVPRNVPASF